jgi:AraC-like DNA-binding protein
MPYIERTPGFPLRRFVRTLWYGSTPFVENRRERIFPSGCAHIVVSLSHDFLTHCSEDLPDRRTAPALIAGQRSVCEIIASADLVDLAGVFFLPGAVPGVIGDRADLITNRSVPLDEIWSGWTYTIRSRMLERSSPEARLDVLEDCLESLLVMRHIPRVWDLHPAVKFALEQLEGGSGQLSVGEIARRSGWSERRLSQLFREQIGFTPKVWSRLQRFQRAVRELRAGMELPWAELAIKCGFYDQAHLANEFRSFAGIDLTTYAETSKRSPTSHASSD